MGKIVRAEFKKIFFNPFIFIITGVLITAMALTAVYYKPHTKENEILNISGNSVSNIYSTFEGSGIYSQSEFDKYMETSHNLITNYSVESTAKTQLINQLDNVVNKKNTYSSMRTNYGDASSLVVPAREEYQNSFVDLLDCWTTLANESLPTMIVPENTYEDFVNLIEKCLLAFRDDVTNIHTYTFNTLSNLKAIVNFETYIDKVTPYNVSTETITQLTGYYNTALSQLVDIADSIEAYASENGDSTSNDKKREMCVLITNYNLTAKTCKDIINSSIFVEATKTFSNVELKNMRGYTNIDIYEEKQSLAKNTYMLVNSIYAYEYDTSYSLNSSSGSVTNAFDFVHYSLQIFIFFIIIFLIVIGAGTIAGEQSAGTMKQLAIKPFKRYKILIAKLLATFFVGLMLLVLCFVVSLIAGIILFGLPTSAVLVVFNATTAFTTSHLLLSLINLLCLIIQMSLYVIIAISLSVIIRNSSASLAISMVLYFVTIVLNVITYLGTNSPLLNYYVPFNANLFKYFGGAYIGVGYSNIVNSLLNSPVAVGGNIVNSLCGLFVVCMILLTSSFMIFNKQDIK